MEDTKTLVERFRKITLDILNCFNNEEFDKINKLFFDRQMIIQIFKDNPELYTVDKISDEFKKTDIMDLDTKLKELTVKNIRDVKEKLDSINKDKFIRKKYYNGFSGNSLFFNKKIY